MNGIIGKMLNISSIRRVRRNHALEHATVHILSRRQMEVNIYARSTHRGLVVYGDVPTEKVADAVTEALTRLRNGERHLAVHHNCGTSLVTAGGLTGLAALAAYGIQRIGRKNRTLLHLLGSLPLVVLASTAALVVAQPLGQTLQLHITTEGEIGGLRIVSITRHTQHRLVFHTVRTAD
jgi:hypothetical protein